MTKPEDRTFWESFFKAAVADLVSYQTSLNGWDTSFATFCDLLESRARCHEAGERSRDCAIAEYKDDVKQYQRVLGTLEAAFESSLPVKNVAPLLEAASLRLGAVQSMLEDLRDAYEDEIIAQSDETEFEYSRLGAEFLEVFLRHRYLLDLSAKLKNFPEWSQSYEQKFLAVEKTFHESFHLFHPLQHILHNFAERIYMPQRYWWLREKPPELSAGDQLLEKVMGAVFENMKTSAPCPEPERLAAYAFDELLGPESDRITSHIHECRVCLDEVVSLRHIRATTPIPSVEDVKIIPAPRAMIREILEQTRPRILRISEWISEKRDEMAASLADAMSRLFPLPVERSYAFALRGTSTPLEIMLPQTLWHVQRYLTDPVILIDKDDPQLRELSHALQKRRWFYYTLLGLDKRNEWIDIAGGTKAATRTPLTIDQDSLKQCDILLMSIDLEKENLQHMSDSGKETVRSDEIVFSPKDPLAYVVAYIRPDRQN